MENKIRVGITHGDTNGVGYELILKAFANPELLDMCVPVVYGSAKVAAYYRKSLNINVSYHVTNSAREACEGRLTLVNISDEDVKIEPGQPDTAAGRMARLSLERAMADAKEGLIDVLVTAPINKNTIQGDEFHFSGHTEWLGESFGAQPLMILMNRLMRVALVTTHLPVGKVAEAITEEAVEAKIRQVYASLRRDFSVSAPRIAVLGLNPHCGDGGLIGTEEGGVLQPVLTRLREEGLPCFGPYSADGFFGAAMYSHFDAVVAMYHDQGLAPFKALSMDDGVNFTAGLPIVRTSPDHGTAYDIAGKGEASEASFLQAIYAALDIYRNRRIYDESHANPLQHYVRERKEDRRAVADKIPTNETESE